MSNTDRSWSVVLHLGSEFDCQSEMDLILTWSDCLDNHLHFVCNLGSSTLGCSPETTSYCSDLRNRIYGFLDYHLLSAHELECFRHFRWL